MDSTPAAPPPRSAAGALYDARRDLYYAKPVLRGWLHLLWFGASLAGGTLLLARAHGATRISSITIYAASVSALLGISTLYHRGNWAATWNRRLQRLDHAMIFFLIAATATPAFLLANRGAFGLICLIVLWALTLTAAAIHLAWMSAPEPVVGATFIGLGWVAALALPGVWVHAGAAAGALMLAGGLLYTSPADSVRLHPMVASSRSGRGSSRCPGNGGPDPGCGDALIIGDQPRRGGSLPRWARPGAWAGQGSHEGR